MTFNDQLRAAMTARRGQPLGGRSSTPPDTPVDLGSGPRGSMPVRSESLAAYTRRRRDELRHVERITIPSGRS
jgi:hypothetical protein